MAEFPELDALRSVEELTARLSEVSSEIVRMDEDAAGRPFTAEERDRFRYLTEEKEEAEARVNELNARAEVVKRLAKREANTERENWRTGVVPGEQVARGGDIYDLSTVRRDSDEAYSRDLRDRALKSIDTTRFPDKDAKDNVEELLHTVRGSDDLARHILVTGSPTYSRAFGKAIAGRNLTREEQEALSQRSLSIGSTGYAVPYVVDPTVVLTSNGVINPVRQAARVIQIAGNHWTGVASAGISASYDQEATEVSDDTPSLSQPSADVEMARGFVQYSMELDDDWGALQAEMAVLFADAKDTLESNKFLKGLGHSSHEPEGLLIGANTGTLLSTNQSAIVVGDLYAMEQALAPRWRSRAIWMGALGAYNKVRQLDTAGGANLWVQLAYDQPATLLGKAAYEWSDYSFSTTGTLITGSATCLTFGDFNEFTIIDRIGMSVEPIPVMFNVGNNRPDGTRGLFARWRNTSDVRTAAAFCHLQIKA
jgi:HK97 family phage major capsid protein